jgi:hypothetical protein
MARGHQEKGMTGRTTPQNEDIRRTAEDTGTTENNPQIRSVDIWSLDIWSRVGGNVSRRDQSHVNTRHEVLNLFGPSPGVIALCPVLMYYVIEIGSSLFLSGSFRVFSGVSSECFLDLFPIISGMSSNLFSGCRRCVSILSIYSRGITS